MTPKEMLEFKYRNPFKKGKQIKKIPKPWSKREIVFTCSNGFTIEKLERKDWPLEGYFMGHCLGDENGPMEGNYWSLRDTSGTPHVTIRLGYNLLPQKIIGRCNKYPKEKYESLVNEYMLKNGLRLFYNNYNEEQENKEDDQYHEKGILNDKDYRDREEYSSYRDKAWEQKRL